MQACMFEEDEDKEGGKKGRKAGSGTTTISPHPLPSSITTTSTTTSTSTSSNVPLSYREARQGKWTTRNTNYRLFHRPDDAM